MCTGHIADRTQGDLFWLCWPVWGVYAWGACACVRASGLDVSGYKCIYGVDGWMDGWLGQRGGGYYVAKLESWRKLLRCLGFDLLGCRFWYTGIGREIKKG
ncbi:hypothetical protein BDZ91DRAFT_721937 [Kalaharituber pfeilii]|nr:hypothetical protein BDZ91DRAFT_721937 [Kalaharituber pfeilii]